MSMMADVVNSVKNKVENGDITLAIGAEILLDVIGALEWDLEDYMVNIPEDKFSAEYETAEWDVIIKLLTK